MTQLRMYFNRQILGMIDNNPSSMHREYNEFYAVHVTKYSHKFAVKPVINLKQVWFRPVSRWPQGLVFLYVFLTPLAFLGVPVVWFPCDELTLQVPPHLRG